MNEKTKSSAEAKAAYNQAALDANLAAERLRETLKLRLEADTPENRDIDHLAWRRMEDAKCRLDEATAEWDRVRKINDGATAEDPPSAP